MAVSEKESDALNPLLGQIVDFLVQIGFDVTRRDLPDDTFLRGIAAEGPALLIDPLKLKYPSDLLHHDGITTTWYGFGRSHPVTAKF